MIKKSNLFPLGIGTWGIGGLAERDVNIDKLKQLRALKYMFQKGMNYVEANLWYSQGYASELLAEAYKKSGIKRENLFLVQAIYLKDQTLQEVEGEIDKLLQLFDTKYIDSLQFTQSTFLGFKFEDICRVVDKVLASKKARFTSITNENLPLLKQYHKRFGDKLFSHEVCYNFEIRTNETEGITTYAQENNILTVLYQPLRRNRTAKRNWPLLVELSKKYGLTPNQIIISWLINKGFLPLIKSESIVHIAENLEAINHRLEAGDIQRLNDFVPPGYTPLLIDWNKTGNGFRIDQVSNVFDDEYEKQRMR